MGAFRPWELLPSSRHPLSHLSIRQQDGAHFSRKFVRRLKRFIFLRLLRENPYPVGGLSFPQSD